MMGLMVKRGDQDRHPRHLGVEERNLLEHFRLVQSGVGRLLYARARTRVVTEP